MRKITYIRKNAWKRAWHFCLMCSISVALLVLIYRFEIPPGVSYFLGYMVGIAVSTYMWLVDDKFGPYMSHTHVDGDE